MTTLGASDLHAGEKPALEKSRSPVQFQNGDRWTVVGDSITQGGLYAAQIYLYYATRFPEQELELRNAGNSGDSADGGLIRYDWDIKNKRPSVVSIMFGMNDVRRELYDSTNPTLERLSQQARVLERYRREMSDLAARFKSDGVRVILVTPTVYDETVKLENPPQIGVNGALGMCAAFLRDLAPRIGATIIDFHGPMTALNSKLQEKDPRLSLIRPDRIHPNEIGHFVMAYLFLKGQGAPAIVSSVSVDIKEARVTEAVRASVKNLSTRDTGLTFTLQEVALPFPVAREFQPALAWIPFEEELNREMLQVVGLVDGEYLLSIDGREVRKYTAAELSVGVNLALEENTPQAEQAAGVMELVRQWQSVMAEIRTIAQFEFWRLGDIPHPIALDSIRPRLDKEIARLNDAIQPDKSEQKFIQSYLSAKTREDSNLLKLRELEGRIRVAATPGQHLFEIELVK